jgi:hypothetical protein
MLPASSWSKQHRLYLLTHKQHCLQAFMVFADTFALSMFHQRSAVCLAPCCRLFWSDDERFLKQFKAGDLRAKFKSYSKFPPCYKDMAFWVSPEFTENNLCELVRGE